MPVFNIYCGQQLLPVVPDIIRNVCLIFLITNRPLSVLSLDERLKRLQINNNYMLAFISDVGVKIIHQAFLIWLIYIYFSHAGRIYQLLFILIITCT